MSSNYSGESVKVERITKAYTVYNKPVDRLFDLLRNNDNRGRKVYALKDISLSIPRGKTIGIIGQNGSGKSTLLQIIAGTLKPTEGHVSVNGKVSALLELGSGFNPEFSGRENVILNATLMGMTRNDIQSRMESILEFADIGEFVDQPVKTYSSGMFLRLAFAAAVHTDPEILIVDEALAVGDARFQNKCFRKFKELQEAGKTILFVSHTTELLVRHCDYAYLLNKGELVSEGNPKDVVNEYYDLLFGKKTTVDKETESTEDDIESTNLDEYQSFLRSRESQDQCKTKYNYNPQEYRWGNGDAEIVDYFVSSAGRNNQVEYNSDDLLKVAMKVKFNKAVYRPIYGMTIKTTDGVVVYGNNSRDVTNTYHSREAGDWSIVEFSITPKLIQADYFISLGVAEDIPGEEAVPLDRRYDMVHVKFAHNTLGHGIVDLEMKVTEVS